MLKVEEIVEDIYKNTENNIPLWGHNSIVIIGDNSTGKTTLIKALLDRIIEGKNNKFYFIDSGNRLVVDRVNNSSDIDFSSDKLNVLSILEARRSDSYFSKEDYFTDQYKGGVVIFSELRKNVDKYNKLVSDFMPLEFSAGSLVGQKSLLGGVDTIHVQNKKYANESDITEISHSEAAMLRILMEVNFAFEKNCKLVIIDEFDSFFDPDNMISFLQKLRDHYPSLRFVVVIHDYSALVRIKGMTALIYNNARTAPAFIQTLNCDDITEYGQVHKVRAKYIGRPSEREELLSQCVEDILSGGTLSKEREDIFRSIIRQDLNAREKIIYDYIEGHICE